MTIKQDFLNFKEVIAIMLKSGFLSLDTKLNKVSHSKFLNIYYMLMSVKELIRNLEEVKNCANGKIYIYIENRYLKALASLLLNELTFAKPYISMINLSRNIEKSQDNISLLLVIGDVNKKFLLEAIRSNIYLVHVINNSLTQPLTGIYTMYNNISDITKLVFIFALLDQVFANVSEQTNKLNA